jgi:hypothetical protein
MGWEVCELELLLNRRTKQVVYRYNGHIDTDEIELDPPGELSFKKGAILQRHGKKWRVKFVEFESVELKALPSLRVYLVNAPANLTSNR